MDGTRFFAQIPKLVLKDRKSGHGSCLCSQDPRAKTNRADAVLVKDGPILIVPTAFRAHEERRFPGSSVLRQKIPKTGSPRLI